MSKKTFVELSKLNALPQLAPRIVDALQRGTRRSRLKRLTIVCQHDAELVAVLTVGTDAVVTVQTPGEELVATVADVVSVAPDGTHRWVRAQNKCCSTISISGKLIAQVLEGKARRFRFLPDRT